MTTDQGCIVLDGLNGWVQGERYRLALGKISVGRSRSCDISLRRCPGYLAQNPDLRDDDHDFNTVSRQHMVIEVTDSAIHVLDQSTNGTFIDDTPIDESQSICLNEDTSVVLRMGTREAFLLHWVKDPDNASICTLDAAQPQSSDSSPPTS